MLLKNWTNPFCLGYNRDNMIKFLSNQLPRITEVGAMAAARIVGLGDKEDADRAAVQAIRKAFNEIDFNGRIVIGEGERDDAPMLFIGEKVGNGGNHQVDIAIDPLENTNATANFNNNAVSVLAASEKGGLFHAPDMYMDKLIVGAEAAGKVFLDAKPIENLKSLAEALKRDIRDLVIVILDRERNEDLIAHVREAGARVKLVADGDLMPGVAVCLRGSGVHAVMGIGAAPEGVITSAAIRCLKGQYQGRFWPKNLAETERLKKMGGDPKKIYTQNELASGKNIVFCATGVTNSDLLEGVRFFGGGAKTQTLLMANELNEISFITKIHVLDREEIEFRI
jgi:fructose-1,6-bisphosphatase II